MKLVNIKDQDFQNRGFEIIDKLGELLILLRYPYQAGNKDFFILKSKIEFKEFLDQRKSKESIMLFFAFERVNQGNVKESFIKEILNTVEKPKFTDWLVIFPDLKSKSGNWFYCETKEELMEILDLNIGEFVHILEDPEWQAKDLSIEGYVPDEDGKIRLGVY